MISGTRDNPPPSYPGRANFSLLSLKNSTNRLHENRDLVSGGETTRVSELLVRLPGTTQSVPSVT